MNSLTKIAIGALATTALAWFLHGPMKFGERCANEAASTTAAAPAVASNATEAPATAAAVQDCQTKVDAAIAGKTINFTTGGAGIAADSNALLDNIATEVKACSGTTVQIQGHTDTTGGEAANMRLSEARANAVLEALVSRGVPVARLTPKGFGETQPLDPAQTPEAHAKNRRIHFAVDASAATPAATQ